MYLEKFWLYLQSQIDKTITFLNLFAYENENAWLQLNCLLAKMLSLTVSIRIRAIWQQLCLPAKMLSLTVLDRLQSMESIVFTRKNAVTNSRELWINYEKIIVFTRKNAVTNSP